MTNYQPSPYVLWIKHLSDYSNIDFVINAKDNFTEILVHPGYPPLILKSYERLYDSLDKQDKTVQLYFYSLAWVVPILVNGIKKEIDAALLIVDEVLSISPKEERLGTWNMIWDDHAMSERLCILLEIKKNFANIEPVSQSCLAKIESHVKEIFGRLNNILCDDKWYNNNHRIFHLLACFIYFHELGESRKKNEIKNLIENFILSLVDIETGFSHEQSIAYCFFDLVIVKNVITTLSQLGVDLGVDSNFIERNLNIHMAAISFPDGSLSASGDTTLGRLLSDYQRKHLPEKKTLYTHWFSLDKIGYYRGKSSDGSVHFLTLSHNAESAHGHHSPLHTDVWFKDFGFVLVDSGGPYKYGSKLRYQWFKSTRGHNSLTMKNTEKQCLVNVSIDIFPDRSGLKGIATYGSAYHCRTLFCYSNEMVIHEEISSIKGWEVYYNFPEGCKITRLTERDFEIINIRSKDKILMSINCDSLCFAIIKTERCVAHSASVSAPSLLIYSTDVNNKYYLVFSKARANNCMDGK